MKPSPRVSVLLPVRDAAVTLGECLLSLRTQTLADHEVVAVDDGSTDDSLALLRAAAGQDPRVRVIATGPRGIVSALNVALLAARAPYVARMDADDVAHEERLGRQWERLFREPGLDVLGTRVSANGLDSNRGMLDYVAWSNALVTHDDIVRDLYVESPLIHPTVMMRRSRLAAGWRFGNLPDELLFWRDSPGRLTRREGRYAPDRFLARKIEDLEERDLLAGGVVVWGAGPIGKAWSRGLLARGHAVAAFVEVDARKVGQRIHGAPVIGVDGVAATVGSRLHLAAVGRSAARQRIRAFGARHGLRDGHDLLAVA